MVESWLKDTIKIYDSMSKENKHLTGLVNDRHFDKSDSKVNKEKNIYEYSICPLTHGFIIPKYH